MKTPVLIVFGSILLCGTIAWVLLVSARLDEAAPPERSNLRTGRAPGNHPLSDPGPSENLKNPASGATPDHVASLKENRKSMDNMTPPQIGASRPARREGKQKQPTNQVVRPDAPAAPLAIRLADDFRLPASFMAMAARQSKPEATPVPMPVATVSEQLITEFYQSIARELSTEENSEPVVETDPVTGDLTQVVQPNQGSERITKQFDERYRAMFGDTAYSYHLIRSAIEKTLPLPSPSSVPQD